MIADNPIRTAAVPAAPMTALPPADTVSIHVGTVLAGADPATSVLDPWCRAHDIENLYIVDGSVFPTSGGVNPTSTIAAFAARAADQLIANRNAQRVPA